MEFRDILALNEKKIIRWGNGFAVYITSEAKRFGWNDKDKVKVYAVEDQDGKSIVIRKV